MKRTFLAGITLFALAGMLTGAAHGQSAWSPKQNVEIIVPAAPGGVNDEIGRVLQRVLQAGKMASTSVNVVNKPGGGHTIALAYLNQHPNDGHYLMVETISMLVNEITGRLKVRYTEVTPLALLYTDYIAISVRADSPIKDGRDLAERLKKDAGAFSIALSSTLANANHLATAKIVKIVGGDVKKLRIVVFNSGAETMTALLGGHVDIVAGPAVLTGNFRGKIRVLGVSAPQRLTGALADAPTFVEQGVNAVMSNWRSIIGPKGMTAEQIAFWDQALGKMVETDEYKRMVERDSAVPTYLPSAKARSYYEAQHKELTELLGALGLIN
jgi:putative tricarboxylic transport membrane protein